MVLGLTIALVELKDVSLSAAARSAAALVKDKLTPNCHLVVLVSDERYVLGCFVNLDLSLLV